MESFVVMICSLPIGVILYYSKRYYRVGMMYLEPEPEVESAGCQAVWVTEPMIACSGRPATHRSFLGARSIKEKVGYMAVCFITAGCDGRAARGCGNQSIRRPLATRARLTMQT